MDETTKPRHLVGVLQKGGHTLYYWQPSKTLRAQGWLPRRLAEKTNAYEDAWREAEAINETLDLERANPAPKTQARPRTMHGLIDEYRDDARYKERRKATKRSYDKNLKIIDKLLGPVPAIAVTRAQLEKIYRTMHAKAPWQANAVMKMIGRLLHCAIAYGWTKANVAAKMELSGCPPRQHLWEEAEIDYYRRMALWLGRPSMAMAAHLGVEIGQRESDIRQLKWSQYQDGKIRLRQKKTNKWVEVQATGELRGLLDAADPRQHPERVAIGPGHNGGPPLDETAAKILSTYIVVSEETRRPYAEDNFRHIFGEIRDAAEAWRWVPADDEDFEQPPATGEDPERGAWIRLCFLDLRRTCVVNLGRAGCTPAEIAAITGHEIGRVVKILETYLPRDSVMAENAIVKLEAWRKKGRAKAAKATD